MQIATPWATTPSPKPIAMNSIWPKVSPSAAVTTPPAASRIVIQAAFVSRLVTIGVSQAAAP